LLFLLIGLTAAIKVYVHPHCIGWAIVLGGWYIDSRLYETANGVFHWFATQAVHHNNNDNDKDTILVWRSMALVHTYMGECQKAIRIYEEEIMPQRERLYSTAMTTITAQDHGKNEATNSFVLYRPNEISDYIRIYGDCAGKTEQAFDLTEKAHLRMIKSLLLQKQWVESFHRSHATKRVATLQEAWECLVVYGFVQFGELSSGRSMRLRLPYALTKLASISTHETYIDTLQRILSSVRFSEDPPAALFQHHWRKDTLWSSFFVVQTADILGATLFRGDLWKRVLICSLASWRFRAISQDRNNRNTIAEIMARHDAATNPQAKLRYLELARMRIVESPTRPFELLEGVGVVSMGEAILSLVLLGEKEEVDHLTPLYQELWDAKRACETEATLAASNDRMTEKYAWEVFVQSPAKVRWVTQDISYEREYRDMIADRARLWDNLHNTTYSTQLQTDDGAGIDDNNEF